MDTSPQGPWARPGNPLGGTLLDASTGQSCAILSCLLCKQTASSLLGWGPGVAAVGLWSLHSFKALT